MTMRSRIRSGEGVIVLTSMLDLVGALLLVAAVTVLVWSITVPGALAAAGVGLLLLSLVIDKRGPDESVPSL